MKPLIFVTNDDGYNAKGFNTLIDIVSKFGRVIGVSPEYPQSGMSHAITMSRPLYLRKVTDKQDCEIYACNGTPVDCVKIAFDSIMLNKQMPDLIISGINHGSNSAVNILYSGTMGAAIEASFYNIPSIGLSLCDHDPDADFSAARIFSERIIQRVIDEDLSLPFCINVNIPNVPTEQIKGIMPCRQNKGYWREEFDKRQDPRGKDYYWLTGFFHNTEPEASDTDEWALANNYISIVPIQVDLTNYEQLDAIKGWKF